MTEYSADFHRVWKYIELLEQRVDELESQIRELAKEGGIK